MIYKPRNDFVVFRLVNRGMLGKLAMPDVVAQGKERVVVAVGPKVEELKPGDRILVIGQVGQDVVAIPNERDLYLTRQQNVVVVVEEGVR